MLFVHDMMNIHDPGVPAGSSQCPRLADGAVSGVLSPHHLLNNWHHGKLLIEVGDVEYQMSNNLFVF